MNSDRRLQTVATVVLFLLVVIGVAMATSRAGALTPDSGACWVTRSGDLYGPDDAEDLPTWATRTVCPPSVLYRPQTGQSASPNPPAGICWVTRQNLYGPNDADDMPIGAVRVPCRRRGSERPLLKCPKGWAGLLFGSTLDCEPPGTN